MIKYLHKHVFSFDVEWVPDPLAGSLLFGVEHNPPHSYEDAFRALWADAGASPESPQPFIKIALSRIVSISGIYRDVLEDGSIELKLVSLPSNTHVSDKCTESAILSAFLKAVGSKKPQLVGYNSLNADIPIIVQRSILLGLEGYGFSERPNKPWEGVDYFSKGSDYNIDLAADLGRWNQMPRLHEVATLSGIPGKMGVSGDSVADMWLMGDLQGIVNYNEYDAFTTHLLWARIAHFSGLLSTKDYQSEQERVEQLLHNEIAKGHTHLEAYVKEWNRLRQAVKNR